MIQLKIREIRQDKGISQTFISKRLGFKYSSTFQKIESGQRKLDIREAKIIADILGVSIEDLVTFNLANISNSNKGNEGGTNCESDNY